MTDYNDKTSRRQPGDQEFDGLFCEDVLREWLQNLEELVRRRDQARKPVEVRDARAGENTNRSSADQ
ncbi:MAG: hypothetical protein EA419_05865 [Wenzhouxiangella sp.]|nr:MAG: hypothetical protein EA419_05865 [Wenzhouxiangella sp.]